MICFVLGLLVAVVVLYYWRGPSAERYRTIVRDRFAKYPHANSNNRFEGYYLASSVLGEAAELAEAVIIEAKNRQNHFTDDGVDPADTKLWKYPIDQESEALFLSQMAEIVAIAKKADLLKKKLRASLPITNIETPTVNFHISHTYQPEVRKEKIIFEQGDVQWYAARINDYIKVTMYYVFRRNIAKLNKRLANNTLLSFACSDRGQK